MKYTWLDLHKRYVVYTEAKPDRIVSIGSVKRMIKDDTDYMLMLKSRNGEIYRYSVDGSKWAVYLRPSKGGNWRFGLQHKFNAMGFTPTQVGSCEGAWVFDAERLDEVAILMDVRKRKPRKEKTNVSS